MDIEDYTKLLKEKEWKEKRETILKRDDYTCQKCGKEGFRIVHSFFQDIQK